ncbi:TPA: DotG/IcmE/VirB10 family protein [Burkholderia cenocepacia]|nr:DotG/IcmE/VirB10 family protein [Burkholderia cenocepacia]
MATDNNTAFDPAKQRQAEAETRDLKRNNINQVFGQGKGRIAAMAVAGTFVVLLIVGSCTLMGGGPSAPQAAAPMGAVPNANGMQGDPMVTTAREAALRRQANQEGASEAQANKQPYIATPVITASSTQTVGGGDWGGFGAGEPVTASQPAAKQPDPNSANLNANATTNNGSNAANAPRPLNDVRTIAMALGASDGDVTSQIDHVLGVQPRNNQQGQQGGSGRRTFTTGYYPGSAQQVSAQVPAQQSSAPQPIFPGTQPQPATATSANQSQRRTIPNWEMGDAGYCRIQYAVNSDLQRKDVFAKCFGGPWDGAIFNGKAEPSPEGVADPGFVVTLSSARVPGYGTLPVQAVAFTNDTLEAGVQDSVNSHAFVKFSELAIAGLLKGVGQAAQLVTGTSSTQTIGNVSTTSLSVQRPDLAQIAESAAGGVGQSIGDFVQRRSDALKTTIKIYPGKDIGIVLLSDVVNQKQ